MRGLARCTWHSPSVLFLRDYQCFPSSITRAVAFVFSGLHQQTMAGTHLTFSLCRLNGGIKLFTTQARRMDMCFKTAVRSMKPATCIQLVRFLLVSSTVFHHLPVLFELRGLNLTRGSVIQSTNPSLILQSHSIKQPSHWWGLTLSSPLPLEMNP